MHGILYGIVSGLGLLTFIGIIAWAWSSGRAKANHEASMLPFVLADEDQDKNNK